MTRRAAGSLYKRTRHGKKAAKWTIAYPLRKGGPSRTETAFTDRAASEQLLAKRLQESAREEVGLLDPYRKHRKAPLKTHLDDFVKSIASRNRTPKYRARLRARLEKAFAGMKATRIDDLTFDRAERFLGDLLASPVPRKPRTARKRPTHGAKEAPPVPLYGAKTRDHFAMALKQFGAWLLDVDRLPRNPLHKLRRVAKQADVRRERPALTAEQVHAVAAAAEQRPVQQYAKTHPRAAPELLERFRREGRRRGLLYLFIALTGLRSSEAKSIRWADLDLGAEPMLTPQAKAAKSKRKEPVPLDEVLAGLLLAAKSEDARLRGEVPASARVFRVPRWLPEQLRKDAAWAGMPEIDEQGRRLDVQALRATANTLMARLGVAPQAARRLMRHTSLATTVKHYEKLSLADLRDAVAERGRAFWSGHSAGTVPGLVPNRPALSATGTDRLATDATGTDGKGADA